MRKQRCPVWAPELQKEFCSVLSRSSHRPRSIAAQDTASSLFHRGRDEMWPGNFRCISSKHKEGICVGACMWYASGDDPLHPVDEDGNLEKQACRI